MANATSEERVKSYEEYLKQANDECIANNYTKAVQLFTKALDCNQVGIEALVGRASANIKLEKFDLALNDADRAIEIARRDVDNTRLHTTLATAFLKGGLACFWVSTYIQ